MGLQVVTGKRMLPSHDMNRHLCTKLPLFVKGKSEKTKMAVEMKKKIIRNKYQDSRKSGVYEKRRPLQKGDG